MWNIITATNLSNVTTTTEGFEAIKTYYHAYIAAAAQSAGKSFSPTVESTVNGGNQPVNLILRLLLVLLITKDCLLATLSLSLMLIASLLRPKKSRLERR